MRRHTLSHIALGISFLGAGCALQKSDDVAEYRQALPKTEDVRLAGPEAEVDGTRSGLLTTGNVRENERAFWYEFTRHTRDSVNTITAGVLARVWFVVHTEPSRIGEGYAEWGPYADALEPVAWKFRVERTDAAAHEYRYRLEGRPKNSSAEYQAVLTGSGYGERSARHGDGEFTVDVGAARQLDPAKHPGDTTVVTARHDLPRTATRRLPALPRSIEAHAEAETGAWFTVVSSANADGTGSLGVDSHGDIDADSGSALEDVHVQSRWRADGSGRADIALSSGDLPVGVVTAVECWGTDFSRSHYADSVSWQPTFGEAEACAFEEGEAP